MTTFDADAYFGRRPRLVPVGLHVQERTPTPTPVPARFDARSLRSALDGAHGYVRRFVVFPSEHEAIAVTLWAAHAWAVEAADVTPYLAITSAEKRSGKSRTLDVLEQLVPRPWRAITPSDAVVFRKIDADRPTLLLDEVDAVFTGKRDKEHEGLRAILNAGTRRGTTVPRVVGEGKRMRVQDFGVFGPKALAAIGALPDTIADRAIPVRLERRARSEAVERFRVREASEAAGPVRTALEAAIRPLLTTLEAARPELPDALGDRAQDAWEPLLAIADAAGGTWPRSARAAAVALSGERIADLDDASLPLLLLGDVRAVFERAATDRLTSAQLVEALVHDEERPWATYRRDDKPLTPHGMSRLLHRYGIRVDRHKYGGVVQRGYLRSDFEAAWDRYLPPPETPLEASTRQPQASVSTPGHAQEGPSVDGLTVWTPLGEGGREGDPDLPGNDDGWPDMSAVERRHPMTDEERSLERELTDAEARAEAYRAALARVRPWLEGTDRTLGEALAAMRAAGIDPAWPITPADDVPV